jgi:hypothetical protein
MELLRSIRIFMDKAFYFIFFRTYLPSRLLRFFLEHSLKDQGLRELSAAITGIVPDIRHQYTSFEIDNPYLETKVRGQHAFQMSLVGRVIDEFESPVIVDIGDSSGTHLRYIQGLYSKRKTIRSLSVNINAESVERIKSMGLEAVQARAENIEAYNVNPDIFLCFQTLEHIMNPIYFLHDLAVKTTAKYLIVTVPYISESRMGLYHIRDIRVDKKGAAIAENTHIFELDPDDWKLLIKHSGWGVKYERIYRQYPVRGALRITKGLWGKFDFEGFYGMILEKDDTWSSKYADW